MSASGVQPQNSSFSLRQIFCATLCAWTVACLLILSWIAFETAREETQIVQWLTSEVLSQHPVFAPAGKPSPHLPLPIISKTHAQRMTSAACGLWGMGTFIVVLGFRRFQQKAADLDHTAARMDQALSLLNSTLDSIDEGIVVVDHQGLVVLWNARFLSLWDAPVQLRKNQPLSEILMHLEGQLAGENNLEQLLSPAQWPHFQIQPLQLKNGEFVAISSSRQILNGQPVGRVWNFRNVTSRIHIENQLRKAHSELSGLIKASPLAIVTVDAAGMVTSWNPAAEKILGWTAEEAEGLLNPERFPHAAPDYYRAIKAVLCGKHLTSQNIKQTRKDGLEIDLLLSLAPIRDHRGCVTGAMALFFDISEQKNYEQALLQASLAAQNANQAKSDFLANMSHEIRTPMNGVLGILDLLGQTSLTEEQRKFLEMIEYSSTSLLRIINEILDFSRIETGHLKIVAEPFHLGQVLSDTMESFRIAAAQQGLALYLRVNPALAGQCLVGDGDRLRQVLINLLGNACKFTHRGTVVLSAYGQATKGGEDPSAYEVIFSVADSGIGIPPDQLPHVFTQFTQVDSSSSRKYEGSGLGLSICKKLVELMGGQIWVTSEVNRGTTFFFSLPLEQNRQSLPPPPPARPPVVSLGPSESPRREPLEEETKSRILLAEDNQTNRHLLEILLKREGYEVCAVETGLAAVDAWQQSPPDLVLMDLQMPTLDGLDATRRIRTLEGDRGDSRTPILAITARAIAGTEEACLAAGMDAFLTKPLRREDLFAMCRKLLERTDHRLPSATESA